MFMVMLMCTEWGDPSQVSAMGLSAKYGTLSVIIGGGLAMTTDIIIAICLGALVMRFLTERCMSLISGCVFLAFGLRELRIVIKGE